MRGSGDSEGHMPDMSAGRDVPHDLRLGLASSDTRYFGRHGGLPLDQSGDDEPGLVDGPSGKMAVGSQRKSEAAIRSGCVAGTNGEFG